MNNNTELIKKQDAIISILQKENDELFQSVETRRAQNQRYDNEVNRLITEVRTLKYQKAEHDAHVQRLLTEGRSVTFQLAQLKEKYNDLQDSAETLEEEKEKLEERIVELEERIEELEEINEDEYQEYAEEVINDLTETQNKLMAAERRLLINHYNFIKSDTAKKNESILLYYFLQHKTTVTKDELDKFKFEYKDLVDNKAVFGIITMEFLKEDKYRLSHNIKYNIPVMETDQTVSVK